MTDEKPKGFTISVGGICCHDWTNEPKYEVAPPNPNALQCECEPACKISYINDDEKQISYDWQACTF